MITISVWLNCFAQESAKPSFGIDMDRPVYAASINGRTYYDVVVIINAASLGDPWVSGVKVTVKDKNGKKIFKKRFSNSYLYGFSDGTIYIGKGNVLTNLKIYRNSLIGKWCMEMRENGIF